MVGIRNIVRYAAHPDARVATGNMIALVIAANGPFYPLYGFGLIGWAAWPLLVTMAASPAFAAMPWVARRAPRTGCILLSLLATLNTVWCMKLLGTETGVDLFLLPCVVLAALLFPRGQRWLLLPLLALPAAAFVLAGPLLGPALLSFTPGDAARLVALNRGSVGVLTGFLCWQFSRTV